RSVGEGEHRVSFLGRDDLFAMRSDGPAVESSPAEPQRATAGLSTQYEPFDGVIQFGSGNMHAAAVAQQARLGIALRIVTQQRPAGSSRRLLPLILTRLQDPHRTSFSPSSRVSRPFPL